MEYECTFEEYIQKRYFHDTLKAERYFRWVYKVIISTNLGITLLTIFF